MSELLSGYTGVVSFVSRTRHILSGIHGGTVLAVALALALVVPSEFISISAWRSLLIMVLASGLVFAIAARGGSLPRLRLQALVSIGVFVLFAGASVLHAPSYLSSITGQYFGAGTFGHSVALLVAICAGALFIRDQRGREGLLIALALASGISSFLYLVGELFGLRLFPAGSALVGSFLSLSVLSAMTVPAWLFLSPRKSSFGMFIALCVLLSGVVVLLAGDLILALFLAGALVAALLVLVLGHGVSAIKDPLRAAVVSTLALVCILRAFGFLSLEPPVQEVRPGLVASWALSSRVLLNDGATLLFGVGPARFDVAWTERGGRPPLVNSGPLWNEDSTVAHDWIFTTAVEHGLPFVLILLVALAGLLITGVNYARRVLHEDPTYVATVAGAAVFAGLLFLYPLESPVLFVGFLLLGVIGSPHLTASRTARADLFLRLLLGSLALVLFAGAAIGTQAFLEYERSVTAVRIGDSLQAVEAMQSAAEYLPLPYYLASLSYLEQAAADRILSSPGAEGENGAGDIPALIESASAHAREALERETSFRILLTLGDAELRRALMLQELDVWGAVKSSYEEARDLSPYHPLPHYLLSQMYFLKESYPEAAQAARDALLLKPEYEDALDLLARIEEKQALGTVE